MKEELYPHIEWSESTDMWWALKDAEFQPENFKTFLQSLDNMSIKDKNTLIHLHNHGSEDDNYGSRMIQFAQKLQERMQITLEDVEKLLVLSIEWPLNIMV